MIKFPNCKINIGLKVIGKRSDGFHNIKTIFYPVNLCDALEITASNSDVIGFYQSGYDLSISNDDNLVLKAYQLIRKEYNLSNININLHKVIPSGAGLGGGSSDAAFMLKLLNDFFKLNISIEKLEYYASQLGSDCPFFINNNPVFAYGKGNEFKKIDLSLKGLYILIVKPAIHITTALAYNNVMISKEGFDLSNICNLPIEHWKENITNNFENHIFKEYPIINDIKQQMYSNDAIFASMSGSGSAVYGIFKNYPSIEMFSQYETWVSILP